MEMSKLTRAGTAETGSRDQILRRQRGQGNIHFPCSADHEQDRQPYPVDSYSCYMHMAIHTCMRPGSLMQLRTTCVCVLFFYSVSSFFFFFLGRCRIFGVYLIVTVSWY